MEQLAESPDCDADIKLQQWHAFSTGEYLAMIQKTTELLDMWSHFEDGFNAKLGPARREAQAAELAEQEDAGLDDDDDDVPPINSEGGEG